MSKISNATITCTKCNQAFNVKTYEYINSREDSGLAERLESRQLFTNTCPNCGEIYEAIYPLMYQLEDEKVIFMLATDTDVADEYRRSSEVFVASGLKRRLVFSVSELIEKINIFKNKLSDTAIELVKIMLYSQLNGKDSGIDCIYFDRIEDSNVIFDLQYGNTLKAIPVKLDTVNALSSDIPSDIDDIVVNVKTIGEWLKKNKIN